MTPRREGGLNKTARFGLALIAALLAAGLLLGRGGLGAVIDSVREAAAPSQSPEATLSWAPPEGASEPEPEPELEPSAPGYLGEPPAPRAVYPHLEVAGTGEPVTATHEFEFEERVYRVPVRVDSQLYAAAKAAEDRIAEVQGESHAEQQSDYYRYLVQDPAQAPLIAAAAKRLRSLAKRDGLSRDRYAEFLAKYVQSIPYDFDKAAVGGAQTNFPVQTLVEKTGVCGDKSVLLAALLAHEGYDTALLLFEPEKHMAVGIAGPGKRYKESGYLYVETTNLAYVSEIPENFISGIDLESDPVVIPVGEGSRRYGAANSVARIIKVREATRAARDELVREASSKQLTTQEAASINARLDTAYRSQFKLSSIEEHEDEFLDRVLALRWIDKYCWWD